MPLVDLDLAIGATTVPDDVRAFLREAERRIERFQHTNLVPGFVPADFERVYGVLHALAAADLAAGSLFCEWGSGFGVVACLAAMLNYDAFGIEIDEKLVEAAQQLAADFEVPVEFVRDSFIPPGGSLDERNGVATRPADDSLAWLALDEGDASAALGLDVDDFNVIFAYPWPDEEGFTENVFERYAGAGAILVTYHGGDNFQIRRKSSKRSRGRNRNGS